MQGVCLRHHLSRLPRSGLLRHPGWGGYRLVGSCSISAGISAEDRLIFEGVRKYPDQLILPHTKNRSRDKDYDRYEGKISIDYASSLLVHLGPFAEVRIKREN